MLSCCVLLQSFRFGHTGSVSTWNAICQPIEQHYISHFLSTNLRQKWQKKMNILYLSLKYRYLCTQVKVKVLNQFIYSIDSKRVQVVKCTKSKKKENDNFFAINETKHSLMILQKMKTLWQNTLYWTDQRSRHSLLYVTAQQQTQNLELLWV